MINLCQTAEFQSQKFDSISSYRSGNDLKDIKRGFLQYLYNPLKDFDLDCGTIDYKLEARVSDEGNEELSNDWLSLNKDLKEISIDLSGFSKAFSARADLTVFLKDYPDRNITDSFNITLNDFALKCMEGSANVFKIGSAPTVFSVNYKNDTVESADKS